MNVQTWPNYKSPERNPHASNSGIYPIILKRENLALQTKARKRKPQTADPNSLFSIIFSGRGAANGHWNGYLDGVGLKGPWASGSGL